MSKLAQRQIKRMEQRMTSLIQSTVKDKVILQEGKEWAFSTSKNIIFYPTEGPASIFNLTEIEIVGVLLHEIGHARYSSNVESMKVFPEPQKDYVLTLNAVEDMRVERKLMDRFPGTWDSLNILYQKNMEKINKESIKNLPPHLNFLYNVSSLEWGLELLPANKKIEKLLYECKDIFEELYGANSSDELNNILHEKLWPIISELIPPPKKGSSEDEGEEEGKDAESDGIGTKKSGKSDSESDAKKEAIKEAIKDAMDMKEAVEKLKGAAPSKRKEKTLLDKVKREIKEEDAKAKEESKMEKASVLDDSIEKIKYLEPFKFPIYEELYEDVSKYINVFVRKLSSIMDDNQLRRKGGAYKSGKLNNNLLYKWRCNSSTLFSRDIKRLHKDYSVCLLVDESGSMQREKRNLNAARATTLLSEVLSRTNIKFEISSFNGKKRIYKNYHENYNWSHKRNLENIMPATFAEGAGRNNDAFAINWAHHRLNKQTGERILIVLSDGLPDNSRKYIPEEDRKRLHNKFQKYTDFNLKNEIHKAKQEVILIGIGIQSKHVIDYYPQNIVCNDLHELPKQLINMLRRNIKRG